MEQAYGYERRGSSSIRCACSSSSSLPRWTVLPGLLVQGIGFGTTQTAIGLNADFQRGLIDRFRSLPMARSAAIFATAMRGLLLGGPVATPVLQSAAWILALCLVFGSLTVRRYRRRG